MIIGEVESVKWYASALFQSVVSCCFWGQATIPEQKHALDIPFYGFDSEVCFLLHGV